MGNLSQPDIKAYEEYIVSRISPTMPIPIEKTTNHCPSDELDNNQHTDNHPSNNEVIGLNFDPQSLDNICNTRDDVSYWIDGVIADD